MANFDRAVTDPEVRRADLERFLDDPRNEGRRFLGRYVASHTSGSQGQPMLILQNAWCLELLFGLQITRGNLRRVGPVEAVRRIVARERLAAVRLGEDFFPTASTFRHRPAALAWFVDLLTLAQTDAGLVDRLNAFRPHALTAYAGVLESLAAEVEAGRLNLSTTLRQVVSNSEVLTDRARERIGRAFGCPVLNNYAVGECPFLTTGCPTDPGAHVNADWEILEVVDAESRPVPAGTPGARVLLTNLANLVQPIIRYEIGDVVTMASSPCRCGSRLPRVERIAGREADVFWVGRPGAYRRLISIVFTHAFEFLRDVREWQAVQTGRNRVEVRLEPLPGALVDLTRARELVDRQFRENGYAGEVEVTLTVVPRLDPDALTGKLRRMVSEVSAPGELTDAAAGVGDG